MGIANGFEQVQVGPSRLARFNEVVAILLRNDVWGLLREMTDDAPGKPPRPGRDAPAVRMRRTLEELGPTFIKIGQLLATRPDLISAPYVEEFQKLYDRTTPSPFEEVQRVIKEELGREIPEVFSEFDATAIASASIGQVHKARLRDGTLVAVKVQHVGIREAMERDFEILRGLLAFLERTFAASRVWQPTQHLAELQAMLERELDYRNEMRSTLRVAEDFRTDASVRIPRMYEALCGQRVLVMQFMEGIRYTRRDDPALADVDLPAVARTITLSMARQIFIHRLFHADPSPGNLLLVAPSSVAFLDFGAVGLVTERRARSILKLITSIAKSHVDEAGEAVVELCEQRGELDQKRFLNDVERVVDFFEREEVSVADPRLMEMILRMAREHRMLLPPDFVLITRALYQFEGVCRDMDPDYSLVGVLEPFAAELVWKNISNPKKQKELVEETVGELLRFGRTFPTVLNRVIRKVERNELSVKTEFSGLEDVKRTYGRGVLKSAFTLMMAALVIGLGIVYAGNDPGGRVGPFLFSALLVLAVWTLVMLVWSEAMKGKRD